MHQFICYAIEGRFMTPLGNGKSVMADSFVGSNGPTKSAIPKNNGKSGSSFARFCHFFQFPMESFIGSCPDLSGTSGFLRRPPGPSISGNSNISGAEWVPINRPSLADVVYHGCLYLSTS